MAGSKDISYFLATFRTRVGKTRLLLLKRKKCNLYMGNRRELVCIRKCIH